MYYLYVANEALSLDAQSHNCLCRVGFTVGAIGGTASGTVGGTACGTVGGTVSGTVGGTSSGTIIYSIENKELKLKKKECVYEWKKGGSHTHMPFFIF